MSTKNGIYRLIEDLREIKLYNMAGALEDLYGSKDFDLLDRASFLERIIGPEYDATISKQYENRLDRANLKGCPQAIDSCTDSLQRSYLPTGIVDTLSSLDFIREGLNICILGPSDSGKSYLAKALGIIGCHKYRVCYLHCQPFLEEMVALKENDFTKFKKKLTYHIKLDLLILDDFLLHTVSDEREIKVLFQVMEKRSELSRSTIVCSQREPNSWTSMILNDEVSSNAIMKRATKHYTVVIQPQN